MYRAFIFSIKLSLTALLTIAAAVAATGCNAAAGKASDAPEAPSAVAVFPVAAVEQPLARFIRATGSLTAEDQADVAAETAGRVIATPIERGTPVAEGTALVRLVATETEAQVTEAEANAAQIEARLGMSRRRHLRRQRGARSADGAGGVRPGRKRVRAHQVAPRAAGRLAIRIRPASHAARVDAPAARSRQGTCATQQFQLLQAARARVTLASKALADTLVRAPFSGIVAERLVSVGDYVTRGTKVAVVVRINPLRVRLTVPEQFISAVSVGQPVQFEVDAYSGRQFTGTVRYVSPSLESNQRALTIEAVVPNAGGELKPGLFATARIEQPNRTPGLLVPGGGRADRRRARAASSSSTATGSRSAS